MGKTLTAPEMAPKSPEPPQGIEQLRCRTFGDAYKPHELIPFEKIKAYLIKRNIDDTYRKMRDYNYKIMNPMILCDQFIEHPPKLLTISFLESLPKDTKRCLADMLLELFEPEPLHKRFGDAMLFRIRHHVYRYADKFEKFGTYFATTPFVGSPRNFELLQKAHASETEFHGRSHTISTTLALFEIAKSLSTDLTSPAIQDYLHTQLGHDEITLAPLYSRKGYSHGKEQDWYGKDVDKEGNTIDYETIDNTTIYEKVVDKNTERNIEVVNRENPDIHQDRSGEEYKVYLDGPLGFGLFHDNKPIALCSFSLKDTDTLFIHQMQTVSVTHYDRWGRITSQGTDPQVQKIQRQNILYDIALLLAKQYGCHQIMIMGAANSKWTKENRKELQFDEKEVKLKEVYVDKPHFSPAIAQQIYDVFAQKKGFVQDETEKDWSKNIS